METTLFYARAACDTMMRKFAAADLPPKGHFYYHQGVFLFRGAENLAVDRGTEVPGLCRKLGSRRF